MVVFWRTGSVLCNEYDRNVIVLLSILPLYFPIALTLLEKPHINLSKDEDQKLKWWEHGTDLRKCGQKGHFQKLFSSSLARIVLSA